MSDGRHPLAIPVALIVAAAVIVLDQATKELAEHLLVRGEFVAWIGPHIGWQLVYNPGAAFGLPAPFWLPLTVTIIVVLIVARALPRTTHVLPAMSYGLLLAGAIGNVLDRIFRAGAGEGFGTGEVVDFVAWGGFWRFNVADSAITIGFVLLVVALWQEERSSSSAAPEVRGAEGEGGGVHAAERASVEGPTSADDRHEDVEDDLIDDRSEGSEAPESGPSGSERP